VSCAGEIKALCRWIDAVRIERYVPPTYDVSVALTVSGSIAAMSRTSHSIQRNGGFLGAMAALSCILSLPELIHASQAPMRRLRYCIAAFIKRVAYAAS
jgi:hypothetical protein